MTTFARGGFAAAIAFHPQGVSIEMLPCIARPSRAVLRGPRRGRCDSR